MCLSLDAEGSSQYVCAGLSLPEVAPSPVPLQARPRSERVGQLDVGVGVVVSFKSRFSALIARKQSAFASSPTRESAKSDTIGAFSRLTVYFVASPKVSTPSCVSEMRDLAPSTDPPLMSMRPT